MRWTGWMMLGAGTAAGWFLMQRAQAAPRPAPASFDGMDADHDGRITRAEHAAASAHIFHIMDRNGDGRVSAADMDAARVRVTGRPAMAGDPSAAERIAALDLDDDGELSAAEYAVGAARMFDGMDTDHDGSIDRRDFEQARDRLRAGAGGDRKPVAIGR